MKKYDGMVFVPAEQKGYFEVRQFGFRPFEETYSLETKVIVLTIEELSELWHAASVHGAESQRKIKEHVHSPNFETYIQSKGIKL